MILRDGEGCVSDKRIKYVEDQIGIKFPRSFIDLVSNEDGGDPEDEWSSILFVNPNDDTLEGTGLGGFLSIENHGYSNILNYFREPSEFFPSGLVAFAQTGGSDLFCFDYREGKHLTDPPIVYWIQGNEECKDIAFLANNFEEFIGMFKPEGYYDHLLGGGSDQD